LSECFEFCPRTFGFPLSVPFHPCSILHLHVALTGRANERSLGTFETEILARKSGRPDRPEDSLRLETVNSFSRRINGSCDLDTDTGSSCCALLRK
jgi:hypothetical protein